MRGKVKKKVDRHGKFKSDLISIQHEFGWHYCVVGACRNHKLNTSAPSQLLSFEKGTNKLCNN